MRITTPEPKKTTKPSYPYLARKRDHKSMIVVITAHATIALGDLNDPEMLSHTWTSGADHREDLFEPLPPGSEVILTQE